MQHVMLMDHANVLLAGQHLLTALSTMENVTHDVQPTVQLILVMDHMPVIVTHVSDMLIVTYQLARALLSFLAPHVTNLSSML